MIEDEELDKIPPEPMNITSVLYGKQAKYHFDKMPQLLDWEVTGDLQTFRWLGQIKITLRKTFQPTHRGYRGGRVAVLKIEDTRTDEVLADFSYGSLAVVPERGSEAEMIFKRVILSYN